jgi:hypothetical protein
MEKKITNENENSITIEIFDKVTNSSISFP